MMSLAGVFAFLPQLILGPFVGVWIDRLSRKTVIIVADLFIGLVALVFALFFLFDEPPYWSACVVLGFRAIGNVFHSPAIQAAVPMLVPQQELVRADRKLSIVTSATLLGMVFYAPLSTYYPLMISHYFKADAWHASMVNFGYAGGMMLCALLLGKVGTIKNKFSVIHMGLFGMGTSSLLCGLLPAEIFWFWVFAALCALLGASCNLYNIPYIAYMQETIAPDRMGRAFSLIGSLSSATMPLGLLIAGPIAESKGVSLWFFISGIAILILALLSALLVLPRKADETEKS